MTIYYTRAERASLIAKKAKAFSEAIEKPPFATSEGLWIELKRMADVFFGEVRVISATQAPKVECNAYQNWGLLR